MIRKANLNDLPRLTELALELWPDNAVDKMYYDLGKIMTSGESVFFLAYREDTAVGFAQCQLRHDYVEGTSSSPVGYLEGIYVRASDRHLGFAGHVKIGQEGSTAQSLPVIAKLTIQKACPSI